MNTILKSLLLVFSVMIMTSCTAKKATEGGESETKKSLVLYYSQTGTTQAVAEELQRLTGADIEAIEVENPYSGSYDETIQRCMAEMKDNILPALKPLKSDISKYDVIYLGYPIWFGTYARPMLSLVKQTSFAGKTIVPFCTFGSGGLNTTEAALKADQPEATVLAGYGVRTARMAAIEKEVERFLKENGHIEGKVKALPEYSEQKAVTAEEKDIFNQACGDYQFPLGTPVTVGSRKTDDGVDYKYNVLSRGMDGKDATAVIYVTVAKGGKPEFTQVVR